jgi:hypothetical protein
MTRAGQKHDKNARAVSFVHKKNGTSVQRLLKKEENADATFNSPGMVSHDFRSELRSKLERRVENTQQTHQTAVALQAMQAVRTEHKKRKPLRQNQPRRLPIDKPSERCSTVETPWRSELRCKIAQAQVGQPNQPALKAMVPRCLQDPVERSESTIKLIENKAEVHFEIEEGANMNDAEIHFEIEEGVNMNDAEVHFEIEEAVNIEIDEEMQELVNFLLFDQQTCEKQPAQNFPRPHDTTSSLVLEAPDWSTFVATL